MKKKIQKLLHDWLGWGFPTGYQLGGYGFQPTQFCKFCDYHLAQDSNGDWFHLSSKQVSSKNSLNNKVILK